MAELLKPPAPSDIGVHDPTALLRFWGDWNVAPMQEGSLVQAW